MAFRVVRLRREARRNAKLEEIFTVRKKERPRRIKLMKLIFSGKRQKPEWNYSLRPDCRGIPYV